jgi:pimeloyl-ACP methyl ester carboxylesterase
MDNPSRLLFVESKGKGRNLVLLHGFLESHSMWNCIDLDVHYHTLAIDLPGHGNSDKSVRVESIHEMAQAVHNTLLENNIQDFDLIGHSMGGYVALEYLEVYGVSGKVILLNSNFWQDDEQKQADRLRVANLVMKRKKHFIREAIPGLFSNAEKHQKEILKLIEDAYQIPARHIASASVAMRNRADKRGVLSRFKNKISILQGETDKLCPQGRMEKAVEGLGVEIILIPDAGHMSHIENTKQVKFEILKILET